jgi:hypothetical protein
MAIKVWLWIYFQSTYSRGLTGTNLRTQNASLGRLSLLSLYRQVVQNLSLNRTNKEWVITLLSFGFVSAVTIYHLLGHIRRLFGWEKKAYIRSIENLYLSCRESLTFYNNYPLVMVPPESSGSFVEGLAHLLNRLYRSIHSDPELSARVRTCRLPGLFCDELYLPGEANFFAILHKGWVIKVSLDYCAEKDCLSTLLSQIMRHPAAPLNHPLYGERIITISECASLSRPVWMRLRRKASKCPDTREQLLLLRDSRFVLCLDENSGTTLNDGLRVKNLANRFCDKAVQICANIPEQQIFFIFEHACFDGMLANELIDSLASNDSDPQEGKDRRVVPMPVYFANNAESLFTSAVKKTSARDYLTYHTSKFSCAKVSIDGFFLSEFKKSGISPDLVMQLAIYQSFDDCTGRPPSMYEPVSLRHFRDRNLDFINPVGWLFKQYVESDSPQRLELLQLASQEHWRKIEESKKGKGMISYLMYVTYIHILGRAGNAINQKIMRFLIVSLMPALGLVYQRDVMASNGTASAAVEWFGTICHLPNMVGVGYRFYPNRVNVEVINQGGGLQTSSIDDFCQSLTVRVHQIVSLVTGKDEG